jgi:hypothetical protein
MKSIPDEIKIKICLRKNRKNYEQIMVLGPLLRSTYRVNIRYNKMYICEQIIPVRVLLRSNDSLNRKNIFFFSMLFEQIITFELLLRSFLLHSRWWKDAATSISSSQVFV